MLCVSLQLIGGLADEKVRWRETVQHLEYMVNNVSGDVLLAAGYVAYLGPFTVSAALLCYCYMYVLCCGISQSFVTVSSAFRYFVERMTHG